MSNETAKKSNSTPPLAVQRLAEFLGKLATDGLPQCQVAARANLPVQYLSDIKRGRRPLTELVARRLGEEFGCDYTWLLGRENRPHHRAVSAVLPRGNTVWLPVLSHPIDGDPRAHLKWEGGCVEISSVAASKLHDAVHPYVLRFGHNDHKGRLKKGDLVLICQSRHASAEMHIVRCGKKSFLARPNRSSWVRVATGQVLNGDCAITGHCVGVIWSALV